MRFTELKKHLKGFYVFSISDIRKLDPDFDKRRISEWLERDLIKQVRRGFYIFSDTSLNDEVTMAIANKIYTPSYVSYETALGRYGLIPEAVFGITSATTLKTQSFTTPLGSFIYRHLKPDLFFGYSLERGADGIKYKLADREKALLDYLYAHPDIEDEGAFKEVRFDPEKITAELNRSRFLDHLERFDSQALSHRAKALLKYVEYAEH